MSGKGCALTAAACYILQRSWADACREMAAITAASSSKASDFGSPIFDEDAIPHVNLLDRPEPRSPAVVGGRHEFTIVLTSGSSALSSLSSSSSRTASASPPRRTRLDVAADSARERDESSTLHRLTTQHSGGGADAALTLEALAAMPVSFSRGVLAGDEHEDAAASAMLRQPRPIPLPSHAATAAAFEIDADDVYSTFASYSRADRGDDGGADSDASVASSVPLPRRGLPPPPTPAAPSWSHDASSSSSNRVGWAGGVSDHSRSNGTATGGALSSSFTAEAGTQTPHGPSDRVDYSVARSGAEEGRSSGSSSPRGGGVVDFETIRRTAARLIPTALQQTASVVMYGDEGRAVSPSSQRHSHEAVASPHTEGDASSPHAARNEHHPPALGSKHDDAEVGASSSSRSPTAASRGSAARRSSWTGHGIPSEDGGEAVTVGATSGRRKIAALTAATAATAAPHSRRRQGGSVDRKFNQAESSARLHAGYNKRGGAAKKYSDGGELDADGTMRRWDDPSGYLATSPPAHTKAITGFGSSAPRLAPRTSSGRASLSPPRQRTSASTADTTSATAGGAARPPQRRGRTVVVGTPASTRKAAPASSARVALLPMDEHQSPSSSSSAAAVLDTNNRNGDGNGDRSEQQKQQQRSPAWTLEAASSKLDSLRAKSAALEQLVRALAGTVHAKQALLLKRRGATPEDLIASSTLFEQAVAAARSYQPSRSSAAAVPSFSSHAAVDAALERAEARLMASTLGEPSSSSTVDATIATEWAAAVQRRIREREREERSTNVQAVVATRLAQVERTLQRIDGGGGGGRGIGDDAGGPDHSGGVGGGVKPDALVSSSTLPMMLNAMTENSTTTTINSSGSGTGNGTSALSASHHLQHHTHGHAGDADTMQLHTDAFSDLMGTLTASLRNALHNSTHGPTTDGVTPSSSGLLSMSSSSSAPLLSAGGDPSVLPLSMGEVVLAETAPALGLPPVLLPAVELLGDDDAAAASMSNVESSAVVPASPTTVSMEIHAARAAATPPHRAGPHAGSSDDAHEPEPLVFYASCAQCGVEDSERQCYDCEEAFCAPCFAEVHRAGKRRFHVSTLVTDLAACLPKPVDSRPLEEVVRELVEEVEEGRSSSNSNSSSSAQALRKGPNSRRSPSGALGAGGGGVRRGSPLDGRPATDFIEEPRNWLFTERDHGGS